MQRRIQDKASNGRPTHGTEPLGIGAVILAAGSSSRMNRPKQLLKFRGQTQVRRAASVAVESGCWPVVVVTGAHALATRKALSGLGVRETENKDWASGMSSSIRAGIETIGKFDVQIGAIVLMLCDQPLVTVEVIGKLIHIHRTMGCSIVASSYGNTFGVPALFEKRYYGELMALEGAAGAKQVIQKYFEDAQMVNFPEGSIDIDTPEDLARMV